MLISYSLRFVVLALAGLGASNIVFADIYRCTTKSDTITLSNVEKGRNCKKMVLPPPDKSVSTKSSAQKAASTPAATEVKPASTSSKSSDKGMTTYEAAVADRKRIIQEEINLEKARLTGVQARMQELSAIKSKNADQSKELNGLAQKETLHLSNLQLLQKELNR